MWEIPSCPQAGYIRLTGRNVCNNWRKKWKAKDCFFLFSPHWLTCPAQRRRRGCHSSYNSFQRLRKTQKSLFISRLADRYRLTIVETEYASVFLLGKRINILLPPSLKSPLPRCLFWHWLASFEVQYVLGPGWMMGLSETVPTLECVTPGSRQLRLFLSL